MSKCSNCGAELNASAKFCEECGTPVPQTKTCPKCGAELKPEAKFCSECGYSFVAKVAPSDKSGVSVGDKNVIAGDVVGESYKIHGNATIVKNEDETKKMVRCHVCGRNMPITEAITCVKCGEDTCVDCMDMRVKSCKTCVESAAREQDNVYRQAVIHALEDGVITLAERRELKALQKQLGLSDQHADEIEDHVRSDGALKLSQAVALTSFEKMSLKRAAELFYGKGDEESAFKEIEPIFKRHPDDEEVVTLYADILLKNDLDAAREYLDSLRVDIPGVKIVGIDLAFKDGDFAEAEIRLNEAERLWPDSVRIQCRRIAFCLIMYMHSKDKSCLEEARSLSENIAEGETKLERSEVEAIIRMVMDSSGEECDDLTEEECEERDLYFDVATGGRRKDDGSAAADSEESEDDDEEGVDGDTVVVSVSGDADYTTIEEAVEHVSEGGTIVVKGGTYKEHFSLNKNVTIVGREGEDVTVEMVDDISEDEPYSVEVCADATFRNITFNTDFSGQGVSFSLAFIGKGTSTVETCRFVGTGGGIAVSAAKVALSKCAFEGDPFAAIGVLGTEDASIEMNSTEFNLALIRLNSNATCNICDCSMRDCGDRGVLIDDRVTCVLNKCKITGCDKNGIEVQSKGANVTVKKCTVTDCEWAVYIEGEHKRWLKANECSEFNFLYKDDKLYRFENEGVGKCRIDGPTSFNVSASDSCVKAARINNDAKFHTGDLTIELWLVSTPYSGGQINGYKVAEGYAGALSDGYGWDDKKVQCEKLGASRSASGGDYYAVIVINELTIEPDGTEHHYIVGWVCYDSLTHWN